MGRRYLFKAVLTRPKAARYWAYLAALLLGPKGFRAAIELKRRVRDLRAVRLRSDSNYSDQQ